LLNDPAHHAQMARAINPYGDGQAAARIVGALLGEAVAPWSNESVGSLVSVTPERSAAIESRFDSHAGDVPKSPAL
jgi:hypothetical protein